jgi:hypothetical protein
MQGMRCRWLQHELTRHYLRQVRRRELQQSERRSQLLIVPCRNILKQRRCFTVHRVRGQCFRFQSSADGNIMLTRKCVHSPENFRMQQVSGSVSSVRWAHMPDRRDKRNALHVLREVFRMLWEPSPARRVTRVRAESTHVLHSTETA